MKIRSKRLGERLAGIGLHPVVANDELVFETVVNHELWAGVRIETSGTRGEAVYAFSYVSAVPGGWPILNYIENELIGDIATIQERGWTIIENDEAATEWEIRLQNTAVESIRGVIKRSGSSVLENSFSAREIATRVLESNCDCAGDILGLVPKLRVLQIRGHWELFSKAAGMLARVEPEIEGDLLHGVLHIMVARMLCD